MKEEDDATAVASLGEDEGTRGHVTAPHAKTSHSDLRSGYERLPPWPLETLLTARARAAACCSYRAQRASSATHALGPNTEGCARIGDRLQQTTSPTSDITAARASAPSSRELACEST